MLANLPNFNKCLSPETRYLVLITNARWRNLSSVGSSLTTFNLDLGSFKIADFKSNWIMIFSVVTFASLSLSLNLLRLKTPCSSSSVSREKQGVILSFSIKEINLWALPCQRRAEIKTFVSNTTRIYFWLRYAAISAAISFGVISWPRVLSLLAISVRLRLSVLFNRIASLLASTSRSSLGANLLLRSLGKVIEPFFWIVTFSILTTERI